ncbi:MAG: hypothetical protein OCC46_13470 [Pseudodesulfovibrio sp.]
MMECNSLHVRPHGLDAEFRHRSEDGKSTPRLGTISYAPDYAIYDPFTHPMHDPSKR